MTNDVIQRRVAEPHGKAAQEVSIKVESPAAELEEARSNASAGRDRCIGHYGKTKLFGLGSYRPTTGNANRR